MGLLKRKKEKELDYFIPYFYTMGSWWAHNRTIQGNKVLYNGCYRVSKSDVPQQYLEF